MRWHFADIDFFAAVEGGDRVGASGLLVDRRDDLRETARTAVDRYLVASDDARRRVGRRRR
jgi:hypothetical protein